jgi:hypothetical protein
MREPNPFNHSETGVAQRPPSAVRAGSCWVGLIGLCVGISLMWQLKWPIGTATVCLLAAGAVPMLLWQVLVEKVHLRPSTGLDFAHPRSLWESLRDTGIKLIGLWTTWLAILIVYWVVRYYTDIGSQFYFQLLRIFGPALFLLSIPYVFLVDRYSREPHDALWQAGAWIIGDRASTEPAVLWDYFRAWMIKGFFLAFMFSVLPFSVRAVLAGWDQMPEQPQVFFHWTIEFMFLVDATFSTIGYLLTLKLMDSHIRSANPYTAAWVAALVCYPPFIWAGSGRILEFQVGGHEWLFWFGRSPLLSAVWGMLLVLLTALYVWATVIFGIRFSNLTNRGIITNGPYRYFKHPAYLFKCLYWWFWYVPFLSSVSIAEAIRNCLLLGALNSIYYFRAKTEERHLMADPVYQAYTMWIAENGAFAHIWRKVRRGRFAGWAQPPAAQPALRDNTPPPAK